MFKKFLLSTVVLAATTTVATAQPAGGGSSSGTPQAAASGAPTGVTTTVRLLSSQMNDTLNVFNLGIIADGATDQAAALQAIINGFPTGSAIHLVFPRNAAPAIQTLYVINSPVRSNGRLVHVTLEDGAYITGSGYLGVDRVDQTIGQQKFEQSGYSNGYFGGTSLNVSYGPKTYIDNYSQGPNTNVTNQIYTDTRFAATGVGGTASGTNGGGQLELLDQRILSAANLMDGTGLSGYFQEILGPAINEINYSLGNSISSQLWAEYDLYSGALNSPLTDQTGFQTPVGGILIAAGNGGALQPWNAVVPGNGGTGFRVGGSASGVSLQYPAQIDNRWPFYPAIFGTIQNPAAVTTTWSIVISGDTITLNGGGGTGSLADVVSSINTYAVSNSRTYRAQVTGTGASSPASVIVIYNTVQRDAGTITLANGTGTPLATLGLTSGTYKVNIANNGCPSGTNCTSNYGTAIGFPRTLGQQLVAQNSAITIYNCYGQSVQSACVPIAVTFNTTGTQGDLVSMANTINGAGLPGISAGISTWGGSGRLYIQAYIPQQPFGLIISNSTNAPLSTIGITPGTWFPTTPPHAWAIAQSEAMGDQGTGTSFTFAAGDVLSVGYSLQNSNTTKIGPVNVTVGSDTLDQAASAINVALLAAGYKYALNLTANSSQGNAQLTLATTDAAKLYPGMAVFDPAHTDGGTGTLFLNGTYIQDVNIATGVVTLTGGPQSSMTTGATVWFGYLKADVWNTSSAGAALRIQNYLGGSVWAADSTNSPLEEMNMIPGQHWPGQQPSAWEIGFQVDYSSIAAGGSGVMFGGSLPQQYADPVQYSGYPARVKYQWQHGIRMDEATFNDGNALDLGYSQNISWGPPSSTQYKMKVDSSGNLTYNTVKVANPSGLFTTPVLVASLPTCNSTNQGLFASVSNSNTTTYLATVTSGGSNIVPVFCNGTNWVLH